MVSTKEIAARPQQGLGFRNRTLVTRRKQGVLLVTNAAPILRSTRVLEKKDTREQDRNPGSDLISGMGKSWAY